MKLFHKTTQVVLRSEEQRDEYIEKLQKAHVDYRVFEGQNIQPLNSYYFKTQIPDRNCPLLKTGIDLFA